MHCDLTYFQKATLPCSGAKIKKLILTPTAPLVANRTAKRVLMASSVSARAEVTCINLQR